MTSNASNGISDLTTEQPTPGTVLLHVLPPPQAPVTRESAAVWLQSVEADLWLRILQALPPHATRGAEDAVGTLTRDLAGMLYAFGRAVAGERITFARCRCEARVTRQLALLKLVLEHDEDPLPDAFPLRLLADAQVGAEAALDAEGRYLELGQQVAEERLADVAEQLMDAARSLQPAAQVAS